MRTSDPIKIVVLCCDGRYQRYLIKRLRDTYQVMGIVIRREKRPKGSLGSRLRRYLNPVKLVRYLVARWDMWRSSKVAGSLLEKLFGAMEITDDCMDGIPMVIVENINDPRAVAFVEHHAPDIVCVNGTNLLRKPMRDLIPRIPLGIINLHTGLSPYTRGGNCILYALIEGHPEWVGVTVHHIDSGIDSGDLILTAQVPIAVDDNFDMIDARAFHLGIELLLVAIQQLIEGRDQRVPQWENGRLYLRRTGFVYDPYQRFQVNRILAKGLVRDYLANKTARDVNVRLVGIPR